MTEAEGATDNMQTDREGSLKITLESTPEIAFIDHIEARLWRGTTARGTPVVALIARIATARGTDASELERDLVEQTAQTRVEPLDEASLPVPTPAWLAGAFKAIYRAAERTLLVTSLDEVRLVRDGLRREIERFAPLVELASLVQELANPTDDAPIGDLPRSIVRAIAHHPAVSDEGDATAAAAWILAALRGAAMGWHGRREHPTELDVLEIRAAPEGEAARSAWRTGFRLAVTAEASPEPGDEVAAAAASPGPEPSSPPPETPRPIAPVPPSEARARAELLRRGLDLNAINAHRRRVGLDEVSPGRMLEMMDTNIRARDGALQAMANRRRCRVCGCTDTDCSGCMQKTGERCSWVIIGVSEDASGNVTRNDLCSACVDHTRSVQ